jgi:AhpD family alkylhydroperoxidase
MEARMQNPAFVLPDVMGAIQQLNKAIFAAGVPRETLELVHLRASQINGCSTCVYGGAHAAKHAGMSDERLWSVATWRDAPWFSDAERVALALAEAATRLADSPEGVSDEVWNAAAAHYGEQELAAIIMMIGTTNLFNRVNATVKQPAGATWD